MYKSRNRLTAIREFIRIKLLDSLLSLYVALKYFLVFVGLSYILFRGGSVHKRFAKRFKGKTQINKIKYCLGGGKMDIRYPVGTFNLHGAITPSDVEGWIAEIEDTPRLVKKAVARLSDNQLDTPYRDGGWTIRQVVHHLFDSHVNSYIRLKLALTEETPVIKPYHEDLWAELPDSKMPVDVSLVLLEALHNRWVTILRNLSEEDLERTFLHPESGEFTIKKMIALYAWHGRHHTAHITSLCQRMNW